MINDFPTDDDPFNIICAFSPDNLFYYLYEVDLLGMKRLTQKEVDLIPTKDLTNNFRFPQELVGKVMYYVMEEYIKEKDPGNALEYVFLCRNTVKHIYYTMFGGSTGIARERSMIVTMIRRITQTLRNLYYIAEQMEAIEDPNFTHRFYIGLIHPYYHCFYTDYYNCGLYPYLLQIGTCKQNYDGTSWKLMVSEEGQVGAAYTPWCRGYENQGIWKVYELAWPLITLNYYFDADRIDRASFNEFYRLIKLMFGKYTIIQTE